MSNGKGSRARNNHSEAFRANYDGIDWKPLDKNRKRKELTDFFVIMPDTPDYGWFVKNPSKRPNGLSSTSKASKPLKTQGNGPEKAITGSHKEAK